MENTDRTSINSIRTNSVGDKENIAFERKNSKVYLDFIDSSKYMGQKAQEALFINDENEEELKIDGNASSLDCYSDPEELP